MSNKNLKSILVKRGNSIKEVMRVIDRNALGIAFIVDASQKLLGVVTDGDIRRAILAGIDVKKPIEEISNKKPLLVRQKTMESDLARLKRLADTKSKIPSGGSLKIPVVNEKNIIMDLVFIYSDGSRILNSSSKKSVKEGIKKVLLTGGAGYLGSVLSHELLDRGYRVRVLDNLVYGDEGIKDLYQNKNFELVKGDIRNISALTESMKGMDAVIHLAAIVGDPASQLDPKKTIEINYLSTKAAAEAAKFNQINKFLFTSTCSVYGASRTPNDRLEEESPLNPVSLYAETKLKSEEGILSLVDENFVPTIFRFGTLYGVSPRMRFDLVINTLTARALLEGKFSIFGGNQWRPNLAVSDAARACLLWLESPMGKSAREIFNVGVNEQNRQILEIGKMVKKIIPQAEMEIKKVAEDRRDYNVSFDKISRTLGFRAKETIEEGIKKIKNLIETQRIKDFNHQKYNNCRFLSRQAKGATFK